MVAASTIQDGRAKRIDFIGDCQSYARNNGLLDTIQNTYRFPQRGGRQGVTYTKLTKLSTHTEVDACNAIISDLIDEQLGGFSDFVSSQLRKVVGELHDNVASHARGAGFSCAQVYTERDARRIEFAIADAGCGMLRNVQTIHPTVHTHEGAIRWCLQKGNTTARVCDGWAQRLPEDACCNPYPDSVDTRSVEDHHAGEGLWRLSELIRAVDGNMWIGSGNGYFLLRKGKEKTGVYQFDWSGVAIEFEISVTEGATPSSQQQDKLNELAERIGL